MAAKAKLDNREEMVAACIEELERDMELLGITGVEGKFYYCDSHLQTSYKTRSPTRLRHSDRPVSKFGC